MVNIIQAIILGIVQGITEWLPISSSGHLAILQNFMETSPPVIFDIMLHIGTLVAVFIIFWKDIVNIVKAVLTLDKKNKDFKLGTYIILGSIPTAIIGFIFRDLFKSFYHSMTAVGIALIVTGLILLFTKNAKGKKKLTWVDALIVGTVQGLAIIPGISRSGSTISAALYRKVDRYEAARYSFLLSVPAILGAAIFEAGDLANGAVALMPTIIGTLIAAVSGYFALKWLLKLILAKKLHVFSWYCFAIGIILLVI